MDFYEVKRYETYNEEIYMITINHTDRIYIHFSKDEEKVGVRFDNLNLLSEHLPKKYYPVSDLYKHRSKNEYCVYSMSAYSHLKDALEDEDKDIFICEAVKFYKNGVFHVQKVET